MVDKCIYDTLKRNPLTSQCRSRQTRSHSIHGSSHTYIRQSIRWAFREHITSLFQEACHHKGSASQLSSKYELAQGPQDQGTECRERLHSPPNLGHAKAREVRTIAHLASSVFGNQCVSSGIDFIEHIKIIRSHLSKEI